MKIADKIQIENKEYMCTQILLVEKTKIGRVREIMGDSQMFVIEENGSWQKIEDNKLLKKVGELLKVKERDFIIE